VVEEELIQDRCKAFQEVALRPVEEVVSWVLERADVAVEVEQAVAVLCAFQQGEVVGDIATASCFVFQVALVRGGEGQEQEMIKMSQTCILMVMKIVGKSFEKRQELVSS
jgi:hypothetical protein